MKTMTLTEDEVSILRDAMTAHYDALCAKMDELGDGDAGWLNEKADENDAMHDRLKAL